MIGVSFSGERSLASNWTCIPYSWSRFGPALLRSLRAIFGRAEGANRSTLSHQCSLVKSLFQFAKVAYHQVSGRMQLTLQGRTSWLQSNRFILLYFVALDCGLGHSDTWCLPAPRVRMRRPGTQSKLCLDQSNHYPSTPTRQNWTATHGIELDVLYSHIVKTFAPLQCGCLKIKSSASDRGTF
ncbi:hypothetical protein BDW66DRAFT_12693 [Aspergillus desertorum]